MKLWCLLGLLISASGFADSIPFRKSLVQNGIHASAFGEAGLQKDKVMDYSFVSGRVQGGWLLTRSPYLSTTIGASYTGLGAQTRDDDGDVVELGYYGPVLEAVAFPESRFKGLVSYGYENGFVKRMERKGDQDYFYSALKLKELRVALAVSLGRYQQVLLGLSEQNQELNHFYRLEKDDDLYRRRGKAKDHSRSYFLSFRLAAF